MRDEPMSEMSLSMQLSSRSKFLLLAAVFVVPVAAAYLAYFGWRPAGHANYGELIKVTPLQETAGHVLDGKPLDLEALRGKWVMVHVGAAACDAGCERQLYLMRQTRLTQGKEQSRIERLWVLTDAARPDAKLLQEHPGLTVWRPTNADFSEQFPAAQDRAKHIYLVDPLGNLMLRFPDQPDHKGIMKDLRLLLKASQVG
jgi:cytochrome oxidase Cu insertion factor (SCO1/SenC/PrrC family)